VTTKPPKGRPRSARSTKVRPCPDVDLEASKLGSFPPPTEWSEQLAAENLKLAAAMASRLAFRTKLPFEDLYLVAAQGLLKGCRRYDPTLINPDTGKPFRLSTYVVPCIQGAMHQWLRDRGHSSGVRFPDLWRDTAPTVRRMAAAGATMAAVEEATGLRPEDIEAILQAQQTTSQLDPDAYRSAHSDALDEAETFDELADALTIADRAWEALPWADQEMLKAAWTGKKKRKLASLSHQQFLGRAQSIIRREPIQTQNDLSLCVPNPELKKKGTRQQQQPASDPVEIIQQLGIFVQRGKTQTEDEMSGGAAADQPFNNERETT